MKTPSVCRDQVGLFRVVVLLFVFVLCVVLLGGGDVVVSSVTVTAVFGDGFPLIY